MKIVLILLAIGTVLSEPYMRCCDNGAVMIPGGYCGVKNISINMNCTYGYLPLSHPVINGNKLSTRDSPDFVFADNRNDYCLGEMNINTINGTLKVPAAIVCFEHQSEEQEPENYGVLTLVSVLFLLLTIAVYMFLPQLRDLQGLCLMCLCISMAIGFFSLGIIQLSPGFNREICTLSGFVIYFWMIATFFWMNVICINIYRHVAISTHVSEKSKMSQFLCYCCYAWGMTILFLCISLITNFVEGDHLKPGIGQSSCWFRGRTETWMFFYGPVAILLTINVGLFILSFAHLWRDSKKYEVNNLNKLKYKFIMSLKLFLVMGISWVFEVASYAHGENHIIWKIMDTFNCLQGLVIFLILVVFRRKALKGLAQVSCCLPLTRRLVEKLSRDEDSGDEQILGDDQTEVRLN